MSNKLNLFLKKLNSKFESLNIGEKIEFIFSYFDEDEIIVTSSFGIYSPILLKEIINVNPKFTISFIDTGHHFEETYQYIKTLEKHLNLNVKFISSAKSNQENYNKLWESNPDKCCEINKILPLKKVLQHYYIWISGIMFWQTKNRSKFSFYEQKNNLLKIHPLINLSKIDADHILKNSKIPTHPLFKMGYESIGCKHCTVKSKGRKGRWSKFSKDECGIHN